MKRTFIGRVLLGAVLLLAANTACAASFDCAKAGTKVEKMICADPELSQLDEDLGTAYSKALKKSSDPSSLKQQQRDWMKVRNKCTNVACLNTSYQRRIAILQTEQGSFASAKGKKADVTGAAKKYPPYPDVWDWVLPDREMITESGVDLISMDTGDILLKYLTRDKNGEYAVIQPFTLFGHLSTDTDVATLMARSSKNSSPMIRLSDGSSAHIENKDEAFQMMLKGIPLSGARELYQTTFTRIGPNYSSCYYGPAHSLYGIRGADRKQIKGVVIFRILDKPKRIEAGAGCISDAMESFTTRVESIDVGLRARPLADGGFVMQVDKGVLIRFDKDFHSRSPLINDKYFVVDNTGPSKLDVDGWIYIDRITSKTYRDGPESLYDYQSVVDDLYNYLISLKSKKEATK